MKSLGLYVHIPFCKQKCNYCDFYSLGGCSEAGFSEYINSLCTHIENESKHYKEYSVDTIFFGGGTPSLIDAKLIEKTINTIKRNFDVSDNAEISIEANPGTLTEEKLKNYLLSGINRLSIGLQSTDNEELKLLGRIHSYEDFLSNFELARKCGFKNINVDIMYGLPNQKIENLSKTLEDVCKISPEHISAYCLKIEENTMFYKIKERLNIPSDDEEYNMYIYVCDYLDKKGYKQYEISNFSKEGSRCKHNMKYWLSEEYVGFGPSAHSFVKNERFFYSNDVEKYKKEATRVGISPEKLSEENDAVECGGMDEYVMLKLRLVDGIDTDEFKVRFGKEFLSEYPRVLDFVRTNHIKMTEKSCHFTPKGFFVSNYILAQILNF